MRADYSNFQAAVADAVESLHQYGDSNRPGSPHYADQAPMFIRGELKPVFRTRADLQGHTEKTYRPGGE